MKSNEERVKCIMKKVEIYKRKRGQIISGTTLVVCTALILALGVKFNNLKNLNDNPITIPNNEIQIESKEGELISFASKEELINNFESKAKEFEKKQGNFRYGIAKNGFALDDIAVEESAVASSDSAIMASKSEGVGGGDSSDYSTTNVQTKGVDESDIIKTDGKRIYYMNGQRKDVKIFEDVNNKIELVKTIELSSDKNEYCYGDSMFLDDKHLVVISHASKRIYDEKNNEDIAMNQAKKIAYMPYYRSKSYTQISIYDVNNYKLLRKVETEGNLVSARKIGDDLYLVSNRYLYFYSFDKNDVIPTFRDTLVSDEFREVGINSIRAFKDFSEEQQCNYMIITSLNLSDKNGKLNVDTYLGAGNEIYCSKDNLFVTKVNYTYRTGLIDMVKETVTNEYQEPISTTSIHKFALNNGKTTYIATGKVNGTLLNQFSMDEYAGKFRITTTDSKGNNLYVLDEKLNQIGCLENLAKGERIYSTRFMGNKAYVVTYKTVDPLFVIDLSNPSEPKVLGELKIPGYSSYLHPLGEHYLLGFGEDSVEKSYINWEGKQDVVAYATGLKMAIFDVSDYSNPKELYSVKIGGRGSYSELLHNHKVLLLDEAKKIFAFPVRVNKEAGTYKDGTPMYGDLDFEGALVYNIDVNSGFSLKGKIIHEAEDRYSKFGNIERIIYIGNKFYTVSNGMIKSTDMNTMKEVSSLKIENNDSEYEDYIVY